MRVLILVAAALGLASCGNNGQAENSMNVDESLSAEKIVANDVTAIDAVTADAANIAADVEIEDDLLNAASNGPATKPPGTQRRRPSTPAVAPSEPSPAPAQPAPEEEPGNSAG